jgi:hypothetical protein
MATYKFRNKSQLIMDVTIEQFRLLLHILSQLIVE